MSITPFDPGLPRPAPVTLPRYDGPDGLGPFAGADESGDPTYHEDEGDLWDAKLEFWAWFRPLQTAIMSRAMRKAYIAAISAQADLSAMLGDQAPEGRDPSKFGFWTGGMASVSVDDFIDAFSQSAILTVENLYASRTPFDDEFPGFSERDPDADVSGAPWEVTL